MPLNAKNLRFAKTGSGQTWENSKKLIFLGVFPLLHVHKHLDFPLAFSQVGRVLDELDSLGYEKDTVVVISADHGWQLGEHGLWDKQTEFELATRVPLLIKVPWAAPSIGKRLDQFVELVDLHATLADLAGLPPTAPTPLPASVMAKQSTSFAGTCSVPYIICHALR